MKENPKVEKILKGSLNLVPSPFTSMTTQIMGGKVFLRCKGKKLLDVVSKLFISKFVDINQTMFCFIALGKLSLQ